MRCEGTTREGYRCRRDALSDSEYCRLHIPERVAKRDERRQAELNALQWAADEAREWAEVHDEHSDEATVRAYTDRAKVLDALRERLARRR